MSYLYRKNMKVKRWMSVASAVALSATMLAGLDCPQDTYAVQQATNNKTATVQFTRVKPKILEISNRAKSTSISWKKVDSASGYYLYRDGIQVRKFRSNKSTKYIDRGAKENGKKYVYKIVAYKKQKKKELMSKDSMPIVSYFMAPISFNTVIGKSNYIDASWTSNGKASGYELEYFIENQPASARKVETKAAKKATKLINIVNNNYELRVRSFIKTKRGKFYSEWSNEALSIAWNSNWEFAANSVIHKDRATLYYASSTKKGKTVSVNAGHGTVGGNSVKTLCHPDGTSKVTGGSTAAGEIKAASISSGTCLDDGTSEYIATLAVAKATKSKLLKAGCNVLMVREGEDAQLDNIARTVIANNYADYHIAIHYDSSQNDKGAFYIGVPNVASYKSMYPVSKNWQKHEALGQALVSGMRNAGVKIYGAGCMPLDLTQTSYSTIASVDIEVGDRASNHSSAAVDKLANGLVAGIKALKR